MDLIPAEASNPASVLEEGYINWHELFNRSGVGAMDVVDRFTNSNPQDGPDIDSITGFDGARQSQFPKDDSGQSSQVSSDDLVEQITGAEPTQPSSRQSGWKKVANTALAAAPAIIGAVVAGKQGAIAGAKGTLDGVRQGQEVRQNLKDQEQKDLAFQEEKKQAYRSGLLQQAQQRKNNPKALRQIAQKLRDQGFEDDAILLDSDVALLTSQENGKRRQVQRDRLLKFAESRKDRPEVLNQIAGKLQELGFEEDATLLVGDAQYVTQTTAQDQKNKESKQAQDTLQNQLDDLMRLKDFAGAAKVARKLGQEPLAEALENTRSGPDPAMVEAVASNPKLFKELPPTIQATLITQLAEVGFDFDKALADTTDPADAQNQAYRRLQLIRSFAALRGWNEKKAANFIDNQLEGGGTVNPQKVYSAVQAIKDLPPDLVKKELDNAIGLNSAEKSAVAKQFGIDWR